jgi:hypothetical protein
VRFGLLLMAAAGCVAAVGLSSGAARTTGSAGWNLKPISSGQKWLRVFTEGTTVYGFRLRGTGFAPTGITNVRASGGDVPACSISGTPATLVCDGTISDGMSVFVNFGASGTGGGYEFALLFTPDDPDPHFTPSTQGPPPARLGGSFGKTSSTTVRVTIQNPSTERAFEELEMVPIGFRITGVKSVSSGGSKRAAEDCSVGLGGTVTCKRKLRLGDMVVAVLTVDPFTGNPGLYVLAHNPFTTAFILVPLGDPCADLRAKIAQLQAEAKALKSQISNTEKEVKEAERALHRGKIYLRGTLLPGENQRNAANKVEEAEKRVNDAKSSVKKLKQRLDDLEEEIRARQRHLQDCEEEGQRGKTTAAAACDPEGKAAAKAEGKVDGLSEALPVERRIAASAKAAVPLIKSIRAAAGPGGRQALVHLNALVALPGKTQKALTAGKAAAKRADTALAACQTSLTQG